MSGAGGHWQAWVPVAPLELEVVTEEHHGLHRAANSGVDGHAEHGAHDLGIPLPLDVDDDAVGLRSGVADSAQQLSRIVADVGLELGKEAAHGGVG